MKKALKILNQKRLGFIVAVNNQGLPSGVFTDGDLKRLLQKKRKIANSKIKNFITKNHFQVEKDTLATDILSQMNKREITNVCVFKKPNKRKTIGVVHIHNLLKVLKWLFDEKIITINTFDNFVNFHCIILLYIFFDDKKISKQMK